VRWKTWWLLVSVSRSRGQLAGDTPYTYVKVRDVVKTIQADGWYLDRIKGSHRQFKHLEKPGAVTISGHPSDELHPKTLKSVMRQARLDI
jgi:predicted RNA binding protein YcfA (HicA-like mRNA interferase family)